MGKLKLPQFNTKDFRANSKSRIDDAIYSRWNQNVKASNDNQDTIQIYEVIGSDFFSEGFTAKKMADALKSRDGKDVVVSINSPGGDFFEGAAIYNLLREHNGKVTVKIPGLAASAASVIAMAGDVIQISDIGFLMIHNSWGIVVGNQNDMRKAADTFDVFDSAMADIYSARTGYDRSKIAKMMDNDTWLNAADAIDKGFADENMPAKTVDSTDGDKKTQALARRSIEMALAMQGISRKEREDLFKSAFGKRDAIEGTVRDAGQDEKGLKELLEIIKN